MRPPTYTFYAFLILYLMFFEMLIYNNDIYLMNFKFKKNLFYVIAYPGKKRDNKTGNKLSK